MPETVTLRKRLTEKGGNTSYFREGVRASVYFNKNMFAGDAPEEITLVADGLAAPGDVKVGGKALTPEAIEKAQLAAQKAQLRAEKAKANADKLAARAAKLAPPPSAPAESAPAVQ